MSAAADVSPVPGQPASGASGAGLAGGVQGTFDELGTPLREVTFVVVDLETTGGSPEDAGITEVGAVKVRGGEVLGEFCTLVNPETSIPPFIAVLTGITDAMVAAAPALPSVLPAFLEFAAGSVLVAHNAPFDVGFLKAACARYGYAWPDPQVLDTALLARRVLVRDEVPDCKLATLARFFRAGTTPNHRALADARATVDVLHGLIGRLGNCGVQHLEELATFSARVSPAQRRKRYLADALPHAPGVYLFKDGQGRVLYVGKSRDLRTRVRTYFTASEMRSRMAEMVGLAEQVVPVVCTTPLEAEVRDDGTAYLGPFSSARVAGQAVTAVHEAFPIRQCTGRLSPRRPISPCMLAEMGRCNAPCAGQESVAEYARHVEVVRLVMESDPRRLVEALVRRIDTLSGRERYEEAATHRDRLAAFLRAAARMQRLVALTGCPELIAARPAFAGGWELAVVRYGRLAGTGTSPHGASPWPYVETMVATAETVLPGPGPLPAASAEETECVLRWLERPGCRLVRLDGTWSSPAHGAAGLRAWLDLAYAGRAAVAGPEARRGLRPGHRPAR